MLDVSLISIAAAIEELSKVPVQLNQCMEELQQCRRSLSELSYMTEQLNNMGKITNRLEEETAKANQLKKALEIIHQHYRSCEQEIIDYSEMAYVAGKRERTGYYELDWLSAYIGR